MHLLLLPNVSISIQRCEQSVQSDILNFQKKSDRKCSYPVLTFLSNFRLVFFQNFSYKNSENTGSFAIACICN